MSATEAQKRASAKYQREKTKQIGSKRKTRPFPQR